MAQLEEVVRESVGKSSFEMRDSILKGVSILHDIISIHTYKKFSLLAIAALYLMFPPGVAAQTPQKQYSNQRSDEQYWRIATPVGVRATNGLGFKNPGFVAGAEALYRSGRFGVVGSTGFDTADKIDAGSGTSYRGSGGLRYYPYHDLYLEGGVAGGVLSTGEYSKHSVHPTISIGWQERNMDAWVDCFFADSQTQNRSRGANFGFYADYFPRKKRMGLRFKISSTIQQFWTTTAQPRKQTGHIFQIGVGPVWRNRRDAEENR